MRYGIVGIIAALIVAAGCGTETPNEGGTDCEMVVTLADWCGAYATQTDASAALLACQGGEDYAHWSCRIECAETANDVCDALTACLESSCQNF